MNNRTTIELAGKEYKIGFSMYAIKLFEAMSEKSIEEITGTWDNVVYCYCSLKALNPEFIYTLEQFIDILDEHPQLLIDLQTANASTVEAPKPEPEPKKKGLAKTFFALWTLSVLLLVSPILLPLIFGLIWIFGSSKALYRLIVSPGSKPAA